MRRLPVAVIGLAFGVSGLVSACGSSSGGSVKPAADAPADVTAGYGLFQSHSCSSCHSGDGAARSGPTLKGLAGSQVQLSDGSTVTADDAYLTTAIATPDASVVKGFSSGAMSSVLGNQKKLTADQIAQIVAYMKTLK